MESGSALTFVTPAEEDLLKQVESSLQKDTGKRSLGRESEGGKGKEDGWRDYGETEGCG